MKIPECGRAACCVRLRSTDALGTFGSEPATSGMSTANDRRARNTRSRQPAAAGASAAQFAKCRHASIITVTEPLRKQACPSGHESGKARRRKVILDTARQVLSEEGENALTIRDIASRAGISPVTIYNLFGSKISVLRTIFEDDLNELIAYFESKASDGALEKIFDFTDLSTEFYQDQEDYYRALFGILDRNSTSEVAIADWSLRSHNVKKLLDTAVVRGELHRDTPVDVLSSLIIRIGKAVSQEWVNGVLTAAQSRVELGISMHTVLSPYVAAGSKARMADIGKRYGIRA